MKFQYAKMDMLTLIKKQDVSNRKIYVLNCYKDVLGYFASFVK